NTAYSGGGMTNEATTANLTNCTLSGNSATVTGGGVESVSGTVKLTDCTLSGNKAGSGGGIYDKSLKVTVLDTIIANNEPTDCLRRAASQGHNLDSDGTCFSSGGTDVINTDPLLAPLGNYGGATQTMALCSGPGAPDATCTAASPAIDAGDDSVTGPP